MSSRSFLYLCTLLLCATLPYLPALPGPFVFDDYPNILENHGVWTGPTRDRPLAYLSFWLQEGQPSWAFRLVNLGFHWLAGVALWRIGTRLFNPTAGLLAAVLFLIHPLQTSAVSYIVQRMAVMGACFYLWALLCWLIHRQGGSRWWLAAYGGLWLLALGSKQNTALLPAGMLLCELFLHPPRRGFWFLGLATGVGLWLALTYPNLPWPGWERLTTQPAALWHYITLTTIPYPGLMSFLSAPLPANQGLWLLSLLPLCLLWNPILFAVGWFLLHHAPEALFTTDPVFEHRNYLPLAGPALVVGYGLSRSPRGLLLSLPLIALLTFWTAERNEAWSSRLSLWEDTVQKNPGDHRVQNSYGRALYHAGRVEEARAAWHLSLQLNPFHHTTWYNLGNDQVYQGNCAAAVGFYRRSLQLKPDYWRARNNLVWCRLWMTLNP